jgi:hypothetical protein
MICNDGKQKHVVEKECIKIWWAKRREMQMVEERRKIKYEITTGLFSRQEHHILSV